MNPLPFKAYIYDGREYFEYDDEGREKADLPFPENLLSLLYLDIWQYERLTKQMNRALLRLYETRDEKYAADIHTSLDELANAHICFQFLRLDWNRRLDEAAQRHYEDVIDLLPHKALSHIPSNIDTMQKQIRMIFTQVLDLDGERLPVQEKLARYYRVRGSDALEAFRFTPLTIGFEPVDGGFAEVLYPNSMYDIIGFELRACILREEKLRVCKNCGKYFAISGRSSIEYCDRIVDDKGRSCRDVGAAALWTKKRSGDEVFKDYRREYKRRFAWIKAGRITADAFYVWSEEARKKKADYENGLLPAKDFLDWLRYLP